MIKAGDIVQLITGGPKMTVGRVGLLYSRVYWWNTFDSIESKQNYIQTDLIHTKALVKG